MRRFLVLQTVVLGTERGEETFNEPIADYDTWDEAQAYIDTLDDKLDFKIQDQFPEDGPYVDDELIDDDSFSDVLIEDFEEEDDGFDDHRFDEYDDETNYSYLDDVEDFHSDEGFGDDAHRGDGDDD